MVNSIEIASFWDTCSEELSHTGGNKNTRPYNDYLRQVLKNSGIKFNDAVIVDYGIGNAQLYPLMFELGMKKYIGVDISQRSLNKAKEFIALQQMSAPFELLLAPQNFKNFNADVFITLSVIQHFPNEKYCIDFLKNLNDSNIRVLYLQIRHGKNVSFKDDYNDLSSVVSSSSTNSKFISTYLTNYNLVFESDVNENKIGWRGRLYQYLRYELK